ncbi:glycine cleavage system protein R [Psychromonas aquimarina]|uniref:glycine cleavage system protein R n=1 Tax=Psychromonas aquimarina TaxID=444919 RepID=UPI00040B5080|nr:ACT domain-containing protein [Psychromonas aquimarina]
MNVQIMVTVSGSNQTDLVKVLSEKTHALDGKWLNSRISHIDDYFAGLIKIEIKAENVATLLSEFKALDIHVEAVEQGSVSQTKSTHLNLSIDAKDRPGLVSQISQVLSENSIKVEDMQCHRLGLPDIGGTVFTSQFKIAVSDSFNKDQLINSLQEIDTDLVIDLRAQA